MHVVVPSTRACNLNQIMRIENRFHAFNFYIDMRARICIKGFFGDNLLSKILIHSYIWISVNNIFHSSQFCGIQCIHARAYLKCVCVHTALCIFSRFTLITQVLNLPHSSNRQGQEGGRGGGGEFKLFYFLISHSFLREYFTYFPFPINFHYIVSYW